MAKNELGTKRIDPETGRKFYDLNKDPIVSPYTGTSYPRSYFESGPVAVSRRGGRGSRAQGARRRGGRARTGHRWRRPTRKPRPPAKSFPRSRTTSRSTSATTRTIPSLRKRKKKTTTSPTSSALARTTTRSERRVRRHAIAAPAARLRRNRFGAGLDIEGGGVRSRLRRSGRQCPFRIPLRRKRRRPYAGCGAIAQLGERLNGIQEVVGSIPIGSTKIPQ